MKKVLTITLAAMLALALLAGCGGTPASSTPAASSAPAGSTSTPASTAQPAGDVAMRAMWWGSQARHDATISAIEMYEEQNPGVTIQYEFMGFDDYFQKLNTLIAANDAPDIINIGNNFLTYEAQLEPLDAYVADGTIDTTNIMDSFLAPTTVNDTLLGISLGSNAWAVVYDPQMLAEAGLEEPAEDWTWDDFKRMCITVHEELGVYGTGDISPFWSLCLYINQQGTEYEIFNEDGSALGFDDASMTEGLFQIKRDLMDIDGVYPTPDVTAAIKDIQGELITTQQAAFSWLGSNQLVAVSQTAGRELKLAPYPRISADGPSGAQVRSSMAFSVYNASPNKVEAAKFINFIVNDVDANLILNGDGGVPISSVVREALSANADAANQAAFAYMSLTGEIASHRPPIEPAAQIEVEDTAKRVSEELAFGQITPADAAQKFYDESAEAMARAAS